MHKTIKIIAATVVFVTLTGCGYIERQLAGVTGGATKTCIDGVSYLQFTSGAALQVDTTGKPVGCK